VDSKPGLGKALSFNGANNYMSIPHNNIFNFGTGDFTVEFWMRQMGTSGQQLIVNKDDGNWQSGHGWEIWSNAGAASWSIFPYPSFENRSGTGAGDGNWHHVALTRASGIVKGYIDGIEKASGSCTQSVSTSYPIYLGRGSVWAPAYFNGLIDEVAVYNRALSADEVMAAFQAGSVPDTTPPDVSSTDPANNAINVPVYGTLKISFSEGMKRDLAQNAFSINPSASGAFNWDGDILIYTPSGPLALSTKYSVTIGTGAKDLAGNPLASPYTFTFTTSAVASDPHLVGRWHFDDVSGNTVPDSSGYGNNGTIYGATLVDSKPGLGKALSFNGANNYISIPHNNIFNFGTGDFTVEFWMRQTGTSGQQLIINKDDGNWQSGHGWEIWSNAGAASWSIFPYPSFENRSGTGAGDGNWHHVAFTRAFGVVKGYIDGIEKASGSCSQSISTSNPIYLGRGSIWAPAYFNGLIDEVAVYNRSLSADEIKSIYEKGNTPPDTIPPSITITAPAEGLLTNQNVVLTYTVSDDVSSPDKITTSPAAETVYSTEGTQTIMVVATDEAGNTSSKSVSFTIDKTAPAVTVTSPQAKTYFNTQRTLAIACTVQDNMDPAPAITNAMLDGDYLDMQSNPKIDLTQIAMGLHMLTIEATDASGNVGQDTVIFEVQMAPLSSFMIKNLQVSFKPETREHRARSDKITIAGKLDLPSPYTKADILPDVTVMFEVGSSSGTDTVLAKTHKERWNYKGKKFEVPADTNLDIKRLKIKWGAKEGVLDTFNIEGYMDAENDNSGNVTVTLILPLKTGGDISGTQTVTCKTSKQSWEYNAK
jgi:hypothetical protein